MPVKFNIKASMSAAQLLSELKGKISGETQDQVQVLERRLKETKKHLPLVSIRVDESNQSAIVRIQEGRIDSLGLPASYVISSYVLGVNDEGQYFAHEVEGVPSTVRNMDQLMDWMNRTDEGFTDRLQGDILLQFTAYESLPESEAKRLTSGPVKDLEFYIAHEPNAIRAPQIGNHEVITPADGFVRDMWTQEGRVWIVSGREFIMVHPEHETKRVRIPQGMVALLQPQRGRMDNQAAD